MHIDSQLILEIIESNSHKAFEQLVNRYKNLVVKTCLGFVQNQWDAEDIAQEVFIEVYQSIKSFRGQSKFSTWLYRIAVNKSLNHIRRQKRHNVLRSIDSFFSFSNESTSEKLDIAADRQQHSDWNLEQRENKLMLKSAINALPENQRIAFILSKYHELSYKEIGEIMDTSLSSVESLLFRARQNLQKTLRKQLKK